MIDKKRRKLLNPFKKISNIIEPIVVEPDEEKVKRTIYLMDKKAKELTTNEAMKKLEELIHTHSLKKEKVLIGIILPVASETFVEEMKRALAFSCNKKIYVEDFHTDSITIAESLDNIKPEKLVVIRARKSIYNKQGEMIVKKISIETKNEFYKEFAPSLMGTDDPEVLVKSAIMVSRYKPRHVKLIDIMYTEETILLDQLKEYCKREI